MKRLLTIAGLPITWMAVWLFFVLYLQPQGIDYTDRYLITCLYFLVIITYLTFIFKKQIGEYVDKFSPKDLLNMVIFALFVIVTYFFIKIFSESSPLNAIKSTLPQMLWLDQRYLVTKSFEIMFQQTFFMISIYYIYNEKLSDYLDMLIFGLYCLILHFPVLFIEGSMGKILFSVSFFAGVIFAYCITKSKKGFIYSYMIHFGFYVLLATIFWLGGDKYIVPLLVK
jgi:hypothetical protein